MNYDALWALIASGSAITGVVFGSWMGRLARRPVESHMKVCSCGHGYGFHRDESNRCQGVNREPIAWDDDRPVEWDEQACGCRYYDGPIHVGGL